MMALSEHPTATEAVGEVVSQLSEQLTQQPSLVMVFASLSYHEHMPEVMTAIHNFLEPDCLLGTLCDTVIAGGREISHSPALAVWATTEGHATGIHLPDGHPEQLPDKAETLLLLADPMTFPIDNLLLGLTTSQPHLQVIGGMISVGNQPEARQLWLDDACYAAGAIGALLADFPPAGVITQVSQGGQPIGQPFTITHAEQDTIFELGGQPALDRIKDLVANATAKEQQLMRQGIHVGIAVNDIGNYDFLLRGIAGLDEAQATIKLADQIDIGETIQFHGRDAQSAAAELHTCLANLKPTAALLFSCNGRGAHMFGKAGREATLISQLLGNMPMAGISCAGEIGPVGHQHYLLGFTASLALFGLDPHG